MAWPAPRGIENVLASLVDETGTSEGILFHLAEEEFVVRLVEQHRSSSVVEPKHRLDHVVIQAPGGQRRSGG